jgi:hypothetical protein
MMTPTCKPHTDINLPQLNQESFSRFHDVVVTNLHCTAKFTGKVFTSSGCHNPAAAAAAEFPGKLSRGEAG